MNYRDVLLIGAMVGAGALGSATACSGPDPGAITFSERPGAGPAEPSTSSSSSGGSTSSGGPGATDAGGDAGGDLIFGTTAFQWVDPGITANNADVAHNNNVEGKDCIVAGCHLDNLKKWAFAGTVYSAATGGAVVPKAEVRVVKPDGTEYGHAYTDANGNFWLENATPIPAGSKVGVRKEGGQKAMATTLVGPTDGSCGRVTGCHGGPQGEVYVP